MASNPADQDEIVSQFCAMTGTRPSDVCRPFSFSKVSCDILAHSYFLQARPFLDANGWDLEAAVTEFFAEQDEALQSMDTGGGRRLGSDDPMDRPSAGRTLGGAPAPSSATPQQSSSTSRRAAPKKKFATLSDLTSGNAGGDTTDDEDTENQDFFAGGEKSGLAVQNPDEIKRKILEKARR